MRNLFLLTLLAVQSLTAGTASLIWGDSENPPSAKYSVYRSNSACSATTLFLKIASNLSVKSYDDTNLSPGTYCYRVTATLGNLESSPSNSVEVTRPLASPTALSVTMK